MFDSDTSKILDESKIQKLNENFTYNNDINNFYKKEYWFIITDNNYCGDSEEYALTALWLLSDKSYFKFWKNLITRKATLQKIKTPDGEFSVALNYKGILVHNKQRYPQFKSKFYSSGLCYYVSDYTVQQIAYQLFRKYFRIKSIIFK